MVLSPEKLDCILGCHFFSQQARDASFAATLNRFGCQTHCVFLHSKSYKLGTFFSFLSFGCDLTKLHSQPYCQKILESKPAAQFSQRESSDVEHVFAHFASDTCLQHHLKLLPNKDEHFWLCGSHNLANAFTHNIFVATTPAPLRSDRGQHKWDFRYTIFRTSHIENLTSLHISSDKMLWVQTRHDAAKAKQILDAKQSSALATE